MIVSYLFALNKTDSKKWNRFLRIQNSELAIPTVIIANNILHYPPLQLHLVESWCLLFMLHWYCVYKMYCNTLEFVTKMQQIL